ncbi:hypothetical protein [Agromyces bauzanensis]
MTDLDAASVPPPTAALAEPTRRVGAGWVAAFASAWFGIWMAQLTPVQLLLPAQIDARLHPDDWVDSVVAFGAVSGIASLFVIVAYPLTGALSDRTTSRFGGADRGSRPAPWCSRSPSWRWGSRPSCGRSARPGSPRPWGSAS